MADSYTYQPSLLPGALPYLISAPEELCIPCDLDNMDYQAFLAWVAAGNTAPEGWTGPVNPAPA